MTQSADGCLSFSPTDTPPPGYLTRLLGLSQGDRLQALEAVTVCLAVSAFEHVVCPQPLGLLKSAWPHS